MVMLLVMVGAVCAKIVREQDVRSASGGRAAGLPAACLTRPALLHTNDLLYAHGAPVTRAGEAGEVAPEVVAILRTHVGGFA